MNSGKAVLIHKEETLFRTRPQWSIDGKRFVYASHLGGQYTNLFVLPTMGGEPYKMTFGEYDSFLPRWSPDGEWIACISNELGLPQIKILKTWGGEAKVFKIIQKKWKTPMGRLNVRVVDALTGLPTEARVYHTASDGKPYTPADSYERLSQLNRHLFHTRGRYTTEAPPGAFTIEAVKGFEYAVARQTVEVKPGVTTPVTVTLKRIANLKAKGWYSGSNHVHMNYAGQPAQHARERHDDERGRGRGHDQPADRQQGQPRPRLPELHARPVAASPVHRKARPARGPGVPAPVLRSHGALQPEGAPDLAVPHRLRGHGCREPVSVQHRHPPLRERTGRHRLLRASLLRQRRPPRGRAGHGESIPRRRGPGRRQLSRTVVAERGRRGADGLVPPPQCRLPGSRDGRRGFDFEPAPGGTRRGLARLLPPGRGSAVVGQLDEGHACGPRLRDERSASRVHGEPGRDAGRGDRPSRGRRPSDLPRRPSPPWRLSSDSSWCRWAR